MFEGSLHPGQHWEKLRCGLRGESSHTLPPSWSLMLRAKQVGHQVLIVILPFAISTKITLPAVVIQIVPTPTRTYSLEPWLVDQETRMTSKLLATSRNPSKAKVISYFAPPLLTCAYNFPFSVDSIAVSLFTNSETAATTL